MTNTDTKATPKVEEVKATEVSKGANNSNDTFAIVALILGVINLCSWCFPICGCPLSIAGMVFGFLGMSSEKNKTMAIIGMVLSTIGFVATLLNAIAGVALSF